MVHAAVKPSQAKPPRPLPFFPEGEKGRGRGGLRRGESLISPKGLVPAVRFPPEARLGVARKGEGGFMAGEER